MIDISTVFSHIVYMTANSDYKSMQDYVSEYMTYAVSCAKLGALIKRKPGHFSFPDNSGNIETDIYIPIEEHPEYIRDISFIRHTEKGDEKLSFAMDAKLNEQYITSETPDKKLNWNIRDARLDTFNMYMQGKLYRHVTQCEGNVKMIDIYNRDETLTSYINTETNKEFRLIKRNLVSGVETDETVLSNGGKRVEILDPRNGKSILFKDNEDNIVQECTIDQNGSFLFYDSNGVVTDVVAKAEDGRRRRKSLISSLNNSPIDTMQKRETPVLNPDSTREYE